MRKYVDFEDYGAVFDGDDVEPCAMIAPRTSNAGKRLYLARVLVPGFEDEAFYPDKGRARSWVQQRLMRVAKEKRG